MIANDDLPWRVLMNHQPLVLECLFGTKKILNMDIQIQI